ncbi:MAG: phenylalanine 4-monooxygenase [Pseudobdellovibrionaceae bacterium]
MITPRNYTTEDHETWRRLFQRQTPLRSVQVIPEFSKGLELLGITDERIPDLEKVNAKLRSLTGWEGVLVQGLEGPEAFYRMLANKQFPIGNFIRDPKDLSYTPEPDVFHDLYGHIPFYTMPEYGEFCQEFGIRGQKYLSSEKITEEFQRLFWFTAEFALIKTTAGIRIFGAGIVSSFGECAYSLSGKPNVLNFDLEKIRNKEFRIDIMQETLFLLDSTEQLYGCLDEFEKGYLA